MFNKFSKIYPGWWLVLTTGIVGLLGAGLTNLAFSVTFKYISAEFGFSRAVTSIASSVQHGISAGIFILGGIGSDKYGPRRMILIGIIIAVLGCFMMYFVNSLWAFLIIWGVVVAAGIQSGFTFLTDRAIINWFIKKSGLAINVKWIIQSLSGIILLPPIAWLVSTHGWRILYIIAGGIFLLICLPLVLTFVKPHRPEYYGLLPDGESAVVIAEPMGSKVTDKAVDGKLPDFTLKQTVRTPTYWLIVVLRLVGWFAGPMMSLHLIPFLTDRGIGPVQAASMMGMMTTISIPTRLIIGYTVDRFKTVNLRFILTLGMILQLIGVTSFLIFQNSFSIYLWLALYGIGIGTIQSTQFPLMARFFGREHYGIIYGLVNAIATPIGVLAPVYVGWIYDSTGSYMSFINQMTIVTAVGTALSFFVLPPKSPSGISETV